MTCLGCLVAEQLGYLVIISKNRYLNSTMNDIHIIMCVDLLNMKTSLFAFK